MLTEMAERWAEQRLGGQDYGKSSGIPRVRVVDGKADFPVWHPSTFWLAIYDREIGGERVELLWPQMDGTFHIDPLHLARRCSPQVG